ncbi:MAG: methyltransferase domain-containing protein [Lachnospiraceae bacterium]|nr:methyltransferase domain-containing protein [Lachnospiraceae bacterium]
MGFLISVLYQGVRCSILAFFLSNHAIAKIGVNRTSSFIGVATVVSIVAGALLLKEPFTIWQVIGASKVVGIDISEKMLEVAKKEHSNPAITYMLLPIEDIEEVEGKFDVVISSLAFHYVEDFEGVVKKIYDKLDTDGSFIFSQENPIGTTYCGGIPRWTKDENGKKIYANLANYAREGERESEWFVEGIKKYHRMFSTIINTLTENGFIIEKMIEPIPTDEILERFPDQEDIFHKPDFLLIKAKK